MKLFANQEDMKKVEKEVEEKLRNLLHEIFRSDLEDLDFGIYRIMNFKREEIKKFIEKDLLKEIEKEFEELYEKDREDLINELENIKRKIKDNLGEDALDKHGNLNPVFENTKLGKEYKEKIAALRDAERALQDKIEIFSRIYDFFSRYYVDGDLIPIRRYTRSNDYIIPYNGEEVILYWANRDQYYIKTTEYFQKYTFRAGNYEVNFKLREAHIDKNNVKGADKFFVLSKDNFFDFQNDILNIYFEYRELTLDEYEELGLGEKPNKKTIKEKLLMDAVRKINEALESHPDIKNYLNKPFVKSNGEVTEKTLLEVHLRTYVARNTKDYFIHKDLKRFFLTELDFYIKNEMLPLEDIEGMDEATLRKVMRRVKVFKNISTKIIEFLAEIENFEKMLWEKKKFVLKTEYVITLDKIKEYAGEEFLESILDEILDNEKQLEEWKELFDLEVKSKEGLIEKNTLDGKEWKKLPIDTRYFDEEFKWKLLVALSKNNDLDEILDGVLIKSENWQALNLLLSKYCEKVQTIYIDPPFNSPSTEILYKNNYKHSSWLCLIENRITRGKPLLKEDGVFIVAIDDNEQERLGLLLEKLFPNYEKTCVTIVHNPRGIQGKNFSYNNEYAYFVYPSEKEVISEKPIPPEEWKYSNLRAWGGESTRETGKNVFYPIYVNIKNEQIVGFGEVPSENFHPKKQSIKVNDEIFEVWPIDKQGVERKWRYTAESLKKKLNATKVNVGGDRIEILIADTHDKFKTTWIDSTYDAGVYGTRLLTEMGLKDMFSFPKSLYIVKDCLYASSKKDKNAIILDFFAGSGTTAHAVMKLNKEDGGRRKFILVEMADYFDTVMVPRIKKVAYSFNWKDGKPQDTNGIGVFFKYQYLEQYEDTLNNIVFSGDEARQTKLREYFKDYIFHILEYGTRGSMSRLNIDQFKKPFDYKLRIFENGIEKVEKVDLVETFNYLIGLHIKKIYTENANGRKYVWIIGEKRDGSLVVVIWRETEDLDLKQDKDHIEHNISAIASAQPDFIYVNGDSYVEGAIPIETEFMKLLGA